MMENNNPQNKAPEIDPSEFNMAPSRIKVPTGGYIIGATRTWQGTFVMFQNPSGMVEIKPIGGVLKGTDKDAWKKVDLLAKKTHRVADIRPKGNYSEKAEKPKGTS